MKKTLVFILGQLYNILSVLRISRPTVIMLVDGGICSQMYQYLMGLYLKNKGLPVEYNIIWYNVVGRDANGNSVRNFDLLKAFPNLPFPIASERKCKWYNRLFPYYGYSSADINKPWWTVKPPVTILGYFYSPKEVYTPFRDVFKVDAESVLDADNLKLYNSIPEISSVAVHVRRGDLATFRTGYGHPVTENYYLRAIQYFYEKDKHTHFYFFSDDKDYVRQVLLPSIPFHLVSTIVENSDDKGYMDLFLISRCQHQITSKGTLGKFGAMLSSSPNKTVIVSQDDIRLDIIESLNANIIKL